MRYQCDDLGAGGRVRDSRHGLMVGSLSRESSTQIALAVYHIGLVGNCGVFPKIWKQAYLGNLVPVRLTIEPLELLDRRLRRGLDEELENVRVGVESVTRTHSRDRKTPNPGRMSPMRRSAHAATGLWPPGPRLPETVPLYSR